MAVSEFDSQFGQKVKSLRKQAGLTQDQWGMITYH